MSGAMTARSTKMEKWLTGGRFRTTPSGVEKWFTDLPKARIAMEAGTHSIWVSEQLQEMGYTRTTPWNDETIAERDARVAAAGWAVVRGPLA